MKTKKPDIAPDNFRKGRLSEAEVHQWLLDLRDNPHVPESGFAVSAVFRVRAGDAEDYYFAGVNVENMDHRLSTHGEEGAISGIVTALGKNAEIVEGWVMGAPSTVKAGDKSSAANAFASCCGKCRQQIAGLAQEKAKIHYMSVNGAVETTTVGKFLPELFTFRQFIPDFAKDLGKDKAPTSAAVQKKLLRKGPLTEKQIESWLKSLQSVDYATKTSQAMVVKLDNGYYVAGARVEEAAFVDINAAQAAVAVATAAFGARKVEAAWVYTKGRDEKKLPAKAVGTLPLSALQTLSEFAKSKKIPVHFLGDKGLSVKKTLASSAALAPVSGQAFYRVKNQKM